jgi:hypothetical protein
MKLFLVLALAVGALSGCASAGLQYATVGQSRGALPSSHLITRVEFQDQSEGYCGPATLSMVMSAYGHKVSPSALANQMLTPGLKGTLQENLIGAARRQGFAVIPVRSFRDLLKEVSADHPVIVFENLGLSWFQQWHYALVVGFDFGKQEVTLHSGHTAYLRENMKVFENSWRLSEYWAVVVLPPGKLSVSAGERAHSEAAVLLEKLEKYDEAARVFEATLQKWPDSLVSAIGLSHHHFRRNELKKAEAVLLAAERFHPQSEALKHNLKVIAGDASELRARVQAP